MVVYLHEALDHRLASGVPLRHEDIETAVSKARPALAPETHDRERRIGQSDPHFMVDRRRFRRDEANRRASGRGMITSTIHVLILVPVFFCVDEGTIFAEGDTAII